MPLDPILDAWLVEGAGQNPPAAAAAPSGTPASAAEQPQETHLLSSGGLKDDESRRIDTASLEISKSTVEQVRFDIGNAGTQARLGTMYLGSTSKVLKLLKTLEYVHDEWKGKFDHLDNEMEKQVEKLGKTAQRWREADQEAANTYTPGG